MKAIDNSASYSRKNGYSIASLVLASAPIAILIIAFLYCLILSGGETSDNDRGAAWWIFIGLLWMLLPITVVTNIISVILGIKGLSCKKTLFALSGIFIVFLEILVVGLIALIMHTNRMSATEARNQVILQSQKEIMALETYADLTDLGLGIYKLQQEGDNLRGSPFLWDITQKGIVNEPYVDCRNLKKEETWDDTNRGKFVIYDVKQYEGIYIIILPGTYLPPYRDTPVYYLNICKELNENVDIFQVLVYEEETIVRIQELSGEKVPRIELIEMLGKTKWESTPRA